MSKGGGGSAPAVKKQDSGDPFVSGFVPYLTGGQFPVQPQQNYWENGSFNLPGASRPLMTSSLLDRFPALAPLLGGRTPDVQSALSAPTTLQGQPISVGQPSPTAPPAKPKRERGGRKRGVLDIGNTVAQGLLSFGRNNV